MSEEELLIIVKDYPFEDNYILGRKYDADSYVLDDGDIYTLNNLQLSGYEFRFISAEEIIQIFKSKFSLGNSKDKEKGETL